MNLETTLKNYFIFLPAVLLLTLFSACGGSPDTEDQEEDTVAIEEPETEIPRDNALSAEEESEGWQLLFDGESTEGWRNFNADTLSDNWVVENGTLKSLGQGGDIGGDIVYGEEEFEDFELYLEWKISEGGNSGIFYHVREGEQYNAPYENSPEYQLIDDNGFEEPLEDWQKVGADYAMYTADSTQKIVKAAEEWNSSRIRFEDQQVTYWLNEEEVVNFVAWSDDWNKRKAEGKWKDFPDYGVAQKGLIGLQDHGSYIWFKNIKIKKL